MLKSKKINDVKITALDVPKIDIERIKGKDYFTNITPNLLLLARKNTGKTTVIYHILKNCINKHTKVFIFCSTVYKDPSYDVILKMFVQKEIPFEIFTDVIEGKVNHLDNIVNELKKNEGTPMTIFGNDIGEEKKIKFIMFGGEEKKPIIRKPKKLTPKYVFLFDDISEDLRSPSIAYLLKKNRHLGVMNIISTQSYKDITPSAWSQIDYSLLFKNLNEKTIEDIRIKLGLDTPELVFDEIYKFAVEGDHNFLYVDKNKLEYRQNFSDIIQIE